MIKFLTKIDQYLFVLINTNGQSYIGDKIFPFLRQANNWIPLYILLLILAFLLYKKKTLWWLLFLIILIIISDQTSSFIIKPLFSRVRPCANELFKNSVRTLVHCSSNSFSFPSTHATNHFALACFLYNSFYTKINKMGLIFYFWAFSIGYAQIYVGLHYPLDVAIGAILGFLLGKIIWKYCCYKFETNSKITSNLLNKK